jgi:hypothetical protein
MAKLQKKCVFCRGFGMSKEHFWPDWLGDHIKTTINDKHTTEVLSGQVKRPPTLKKKKERMGNLITVKFRVVCEKCNNGWMSQLEERIKPILVAIIEGEDFTLGKASLSDLARWVVMKVIVLEQSEENTQVTPESDRIGFCNGLMPKYFNVFMGRQDSSHSSGILRQSITIGLPEEGLPKLNGMKRNTQTVSFILGPIFFYVITCRLDNFDLCEKLNIHPLKKIFPDTPEILNWSSLEIAKSLKINKLAWVLEELTNSSRVKYGGPLPE